MKSKSMSARVLFSIFNLLRAWSIASMALFTAAAVQVMVRDITAMQKLDSNPPSPEELAEWDWVAGEHYSCVPLQVAWSAEFFVVEQTTGLVWSQMQSAVCIILALVGLLSGKKYDKSCGWKTKPDGAFFHMQTSRMSLL